MIFISYASPDRDFAQTLCEAIGDEAVMDTKIERGAQWDLRIPERIDASQVVAVINSRHSKNAHWQRQEIIYAIERFRKRKLDVVPILLDDAKIHFGLQSTSAFQVSETGVGQIAKELGARANLSRICSLDCEPFVDRPELFDRAQEILKEPEKGPKNLIIYGASGSGKTQLARGLASGSTLWVDADVANSWPANARSFENVVLDNYCASSTITEDLYRACELDGHQKVIVVCNRRADASVASKKLRCGESEEAYMLEVRGLTERELIAFRRQYSEVHALEHPRISENGWLEIARRVSASPAVLALFARTVTAIESFDRREATFRGQAARFPAEAAVLNLWLTTRGAGSGQPGVILLALATVSAVGISANHIFALIEKGGGGDGLREEIQRSTDKLMSANLARTVICGGEEYIIPAAWVRDAVTALISESRSRGVDRLKQQIRVWRDLYLSIVAAGKGSPWSSLECAVLHAQCFFDALHQHNGERADEHLKSLLELANESGLQESSGWHAVLRHFQSLSRDCSAVIAIMNVVMTLKPVREIGDLCWRMRFDDGWANACCILAATYHWSSSPSLVFGFDLSIVAEIDDRLDVLRSSDHDLEVAALLGALTTMGEWKSARDYWYSTSSRYRETSVADLTFCVLASDMADTEALKWASAERWSCAIDDRHKRVVRAFLRERHDDEFAWYIPAGEAKENKL
ncbi:MAG: TIR domain-containing protein, partial [Woeseiaceae bacterium]|nr:TIR domain-containing protein [Woeseiaceae bacterium]